MEKKQSPVDNILGGVAALIVGIIIVSLKDKSSSFYFGPDKSGITDVVGVLFIFVAVALIGVGVVRMMHKDEEYYDYEPTPVEDFTERLKEEEKPVPAPAPVVVRVEKPKEKKMVFCPYCGTAQDEDYKTCESCGAGRRK